MANEILKDEQLTDEQLEQVAGGTIEELDKDVTFLQDIGLFPKFDRNGGFTISIDEISNIFANYGVKMVFSHDNPNEYSINDRSVTRKEALQRVLDVKHIRMNLDKYM